MCASNQCHHFHLLSLRHDLLFMPSAGASRPKGQQWAAREERTAVAHRLPGEEAGSGSDDGDDEEVMPRVNWRQLSRRLIQLVGSLGGAAEPSGQPAVLAPELWQELRRRCPEGAEAAVAAIDAASAARCFGEGEAVQESAALACLSVATVAAQILADNAALLTEDERERLGLQDGAAGTSVADILSSVLPADAL